MLVICLTKTRHVFHCSGYNYIFCVSENAGSVPMCGGFLDTSTPAFLALCQKVPGQITKPKRETHEAANLIDFIILRLQLGDLSEKSMLDLYSSVEKMMKESLSAESFSEQYCIKFSDK